MKAPPVAVVTVPSLSLPLWTNPSPGLAASPLLDYVAVHLIFVPLVLAGCACLLQYGRLDMEIARLFVDSSSGSFVWRHSMWLDVIAHQAARWLPILMGSVAAAAGIAGFSVRPLRPWRAILLTLAAAMAAGPILVAILKTMTTLHCPVDVQEFGGVVSYAFDQATPFWATSPHDVGHCSPSGHASGGYALLSLYFAGWAAGRPAWRWQGLAIGILLGLILSTVRVMQGAHFASATLWSATVDWTICALFFLPLLCRPGRLPS